MDTLFLILAVILITVLAIKGVPIFYSALITSVFVLITSGMNVVDGITVTYVKAFSQYIESNFFIFIFGAIFGKIVELSGAANSIADYIVAKIGKKFIVPAIIIAGGIMGYGGISVFVGIFALYPLIFAMFEKANISRTLAPGLYLAAAGSFSVWMPGSPSIQLLIPVQSLGTSTFSAAGPGFVVGFIQIILEILFCNWYVKYTQKKGIVWEGAEGLGILEQNESRTYPNFFVALLPMVILIVSLGFFNIHPAFGLFIGIIAGLIIYCRYLPYKDGMWNHLQKGFMSGVSALMATCAVVGFGGVIQETTAFQNLINLVVETNANPIIASAGITSVLAGICGSGTGAESMALPIIKEYFIPLGVNVDALTRILALSTMIFTLPSNGVVNTAITAANSTHKKSYPMIFVTVSLMSFISAILLLIAFSITGMM